MRLSRGRVQRQAHATLTMTSISATSLELILKLRVVVGRFGEMDLAGWWNTRGQLGPLGAPVLRRGFPRTHCFAQARSVFVRCSTPLRRSSSSVSKKSTAPLVIS